MSSNNKISTKVCSGSMWKFLSTSHKLLNLWWEVLWLKGKNRVRCSPSHIIQLSWVLLGDAAQPWGWREGWVLPTEVGIALWVTSWKFYPGWQTGTAEQALQGKWTVSWRSEHHFCVLEEKLLHQNSKGQVEELGSLQGRK